MKPGSTPHQSEQPADKRGRWFSGTRKFTGYMKFAMERLGRLPQGSEVLDIPAGHGQMTDAMRSIGLRVTPSDINTVRGDYVKADMGRALPFDDDSFDATVCMEGIEHMVDPVLLVGELVRVTRPGGIVIVSTPNISNFYSRLQFLLTGTFYQFNPAIIRDVPPGVETDRFHIAPMHFARLRYLAMYAGAEVEAVGSDRYKRKALMPLYLVLHGAGPLWRRSLFFGKRASPWAERNQDLYRWMYSPQMLFGRTMIVVFRKRTDAGDRDRGRP